MKQIKMMVIILMSVFYAGAAFAASCEVMYDRTACPGKEKISYKKCKGKKTCSKFKEADSIEQCRKVATKSCANKRYSITKSKVIHAKFEDKPIKTESGKDDFCLEYANVSTEFNRCN